MGIFDRLGDVINSYFNDFSDKTNRQFKSYSGNYGGSGDPDVDAAYEELNDFLSGKKGEPRSESSRSEYRWSDNTDNSTRSGAGSSSGSARGQHSASSRNASSNMPPEELRDDFEKLGVPFGADEETCKAAYKKLMKIHHPDRHAGHEGNFKKATERTARINAAWDRIEKWRQTK